MECVIYRCSKKDEMYLYVPDTGNEEELLKTLPAGLLQTTGELTKVINLILTPDKKLARVDVKDVIKAINEKGYFIQLPPNELLRKDSSMLSDPSDSF